MRRESCDDGSSNLSDRHVINADLRELKDVFGRQLEQVNIETE